MVLKYSILGLFIVWVALVESQNRNVYDFKMASWNTNGARWKSIIALMVAEGIDVLGVQEAGRMPTTGITNAPATNPPSYYLVGHLNGQYQEDAFPMDGLGFSEFVLENQYYVYYYDRSSCGNGQATATTKKQNIAIVSKYRASEVILFPPETRQNSQYMSQAECDDRLFINRPTFGIQFENSIFFTLHTEPKPNNEAELVINQINKYMNQLHRQMTWILMGDFNRQPDTLRQHIVNLAQSMDPKIISPDRGTRGSNVIDFGVVGGPDQQPRKRFMQSIKVKLLNNRNGGVAGEARSDHEPIEFYK